MPLTADDAKKMKATLMRKLLSEANRQIRKEFFKKPYQMKAEELRKFMVKHFTKTTLNDKVVYHPLLQINSYNTKEGGRSWDKSKFHNVKVPVRKPKPKKPKPSKPKPAPKPKPKPKPAPKPKPKKPKPPNVKLVITPKPKPKPKKPKPKKPEKPAYKPTKADLAKRKQLVKTISQGYDLITFVNSLKQKDITPFVNWSNYEDLLFLAVLLNNKNDCGVVLPNPKKSVGMRSSIINRGTSRGGANARYAFDIPKGIKAKVFQKTMAVRIAEGIKRCRIRNKVVATGYVLNGHMNMLLFNYKRNEVERFEPHGGATGFTGKYLNRIDGHLTTFVNDYLNPELKKIGEPTMKYQTLPQSCPLDKKTGVGGKFWNGLQGVFRSKDMGIQKKDLVIDLDGKSSFKIKIGDPNGWCVAWSAFYLDQRLKNLSAPSSEIKREVKKALKTLKGSGKIRNTLRTLAKYQYEQIKKVKGLMKLTPFERGVMLLMIDKGRQGNHQDFTKKVEDLFKSAYGADGMKEFNSFKNKIDAELKKRNLSPQSFIYDKLKVFWAYTIGDYVAKSLGTITN